MNMSSRSLKTAVYTSVNGNIVSYTPKTAKIKKGDSTQQRIDIGDVLLGNITGQNS